MSARISRRKRRDRSALFIAFALLLAVVAAWWILSNRSVEARKEALAGVPDFPLPGQEIIRREPNEKLPRPIARPVPKPIDAGVVKVARKVDRLNAFVLKPARSVVMIQVNALFNTPLFDRFRECAPRELKQMEDSAQRQGFDLEHDVDRIAMIPGGNIAMSGFFEGKPVAEMMSGQSTAAGGANLDQWQTHYRDQTILWTADGACVVQMGNLILFSGQQPEGCKALIDRVLDPVEDENAADDIYGELYARTDLSDLTRSMGATQSNSGDAFAQLFNSLSGATVRANVWDDVAVSFEGDPKTSDQLLALSQMARGALSLAKDQIGDGDDKAAALASLANVTTQDGKLKLDLALPADQLFSTFHIPCPGLADAGAK